MDWSRRRARLVTLRSGSNLVTLADVRTFHCKWLRANRRESSNRRRATALLLSAARSDKVAVADVTIALEMAVSEYEGPHRGHALSAAKAGRLEHDPEKACPREGGGCGFSDKIMRQNKYLERNRNSI
jgi:hypothetical protein